MRFVVDTNILFSFFNEKSKARELSTSSSFILYSPEFALTELEKYKSDILKRFSLSELHFSLIVKFLETTINFVKKDEYKEFLSKAKKLSPDPDDVDFFALSLKFNELMKGVKNLIDDDLIKLGRELKKGRGTKHSSVK